MRLLTPSRVLAFAVLIAVLGTPLYRLVTGFSMASPALPVIHVGIPRQTGNAAWYLALERRVFESQGVRVVEHPYALGVQAQQAMIDGEIDLAIVADTPFMLALLHGAPLSMIATTYDSRTSLALSARRAAGITTPASLRGRRIGYVPGTNLQYFLDSFLIAHGLGRDAPELVAVGADDVVPRLLDGDVDAVVSWEPLRAQLRETLGEGLVEFSGAELYAFRFVLAGKTSFVASRTPELTALLRALHIASDLLAADPAAAAQLTARHLDAPVPGPLDPLEHGIGLDQGLVMALERQARWATTAGLAPPQPSFNVLRHIDPAPLLAAAPDRVTLVH